MRQSLSRCHCEGRLPNLRVPISVACQTQPLRTSGPRRGIVTQAQQLKDGTTNALITTKGQTAEGTAAHPHHREASATSPTHVELKCSPGQLLSVTAVASALAGAVLFGPGPLPAALQQPLYIAQSLGVLAAIVAVHEAGHFAAARLQGIHVSKFAIGFGPPLVTFTRGSVEYSLRLIPMGGFVAFPDDDPKSNIPKDDPNLLRNRSIPERGAVISAGVIANMVFAYAALLLQAGTVGKAQTALLPGVRVSEVAAASAAGRAGLRDGDIITAINGSKLPASPDSVSQVISVIRVNANQPLAITVQRQAAPDLVDISVTPDLAKDGKGRLGVGLYPNSYIEHIKGESLQGVVSIASTEFSRLTSTVVGGLTALFTNFGKVAGQLSGPVAIVAAGSQIAKTDAAGLFQYCAIVNINLAVVNLLPLPALDGGYLVLLLLEAAWGGRKLPQSVEQGFAVLSAAGFLLLMVAGVSLVVKDTMGLLPGL